MKKSLSLILAIAMVFSMFASVAFADTTTMTTQQKYDALATAGIFKGIPGQGAALDAPMTRAQVATILTRTFNLTVDDNATASYSDDVSHWAKGAIEAVTAAGYMKGVGAGKFDPDSHFTIEQLAIVFVRALNLTTDANAAVSGNVDSWAKAEVAAAIAAGLIPASNDYTVEGNRGLLAGVTYTAYQSVNVTTASAAQTAGDTIAVTFSKAVDTSAVTFDVKQDSSFTINTKPVTWNDAKTVATIQAYNNLATGTYSVDVMGAGLKNSSLSVTVTASTVSKITFSSDKAVLTATGSVYGTVGYQVFDQFGTDVTANTTIKASTSASNAVVDNSTGTVTITFAAAPTAGDPVVVNLIDQDTSTVASKTLTVADASSVSMVQMGSLQNVDKMVLRASTDVTTNYFEFPITAKDQYGNDITDPTTLGNDFNIYYSSNASTNLTATFVTDNSMPYLRLSNIPAAGTYTITLVSKGTSPATATGTVVVADDVTLTTFQMATPTDLVVQNESVYVSFTAKDQDGNPLTQYSDLAGKVSFSPTSAMSWEKNALDGTAKLKLTAPASGNTLVVTSIVGTSVSTINVVVHDTAVATRITGLADGTVTDVVYNGTTSLDSTSLTVVDQYNRTMDLPTGYSIKLTANDGTFDGVAYDGKDITPSQAQAAGFTGVSTAGSELVTATLYNGATAVSNSSYQLSLGTIDKANIATYVIDTADKLYAPVVGSSPTAYSASSVNAAYASDLSIYGQTASGVKVALASSDIVNVNSADANLELASGNTKAYAQNMTDSATDETATIVVAINTASGIQTVTKNVTLTNAAPVGGDVTVAATTDTTKYVDQSGNEFVMTAAEVTAQSGKVFSASSVTATDVYFQVLDQYGVASAAVAPTYYTLTAKDTNGNDITTSSKYAVATNGTFTVTGTPASGDTVTVTAITKAGKVTSMVIVVQ